MQMTISYICKIVKLKIIWDVCLSFIVLEEI